MKRVCIAYGKISLPFARPSKRSRAGRTEENLGYARTIATTIASSRDGDWPTDATPLGAGFSLYLLSLPFHLWRMVGGGRTSRGVYAASPFCLRCSGGIARAEVGTTAYAR